MNQKFVKPSYLFSISFTSCRGAGATLAVKQNNDVFWA